MVTQTIWIRYLLQNLKTISNQVSWWKVFIVQKNSKPVFKISPAIDETVKKKYSLKDFSKIRFSTNDSNLSKNIDKIAYWF